MHAAIHLDATSQLQEFLIVFLVSLLCAMPQFQILVQRMGSMRVSFSYELTHPIMRSKLYA